jgi:PadR family transcriptional regulator PadR
MPSAEPTDFLPMGPTDFQLLLALIKRPLHGYAIMKAVEDASSGRVRIEVGSLYRIIGRLLASGLIREAADDDDTPRPGRQRRSYTLTDLGVAVARAEAGRLRDTVALAQAEELLAEGEGA